MALAKLALPFPTYSGPTQPALENALCGGTTLFAAPAGYILTSKLAGLIQQRQAPAVWLRAGVEDRDPATLLVSLVSGVDAAFPGLAQHTFERMRQRPGPVYGWAPLFSELARDLSAASRDLGAPPVIVIQHLDALLDPMQGAGSVLPRDFSAPSQYSAPLHALQLLKDVFLPLLPVGSANILISHTFPARGLLPGYVVQRSTRDLRLGEEEALAFVQENLITGRRAGERTPSFTLSSLRRLVALSEGCGSVLAGLAMTYSTLGGPTFEQVVEAATNRADLMARVTRCCLQTGPLRAADYLSLFLRISYLNQGAVQAALNEPDGVCQDLLSCWMPASGWFQPLVGGWARLRCAWHEPIQQAVRTAEGGAQGIIRRAASHLAQSGDYDQAIPLLIELGLHPEAAQAVEQVVEPMIDRGQWETVSGWLANLPERTRRDRPALLYAEGELAAARGQSRSARRIFAAASETFSRRGNIQGACRSLLNESILAARQNNLIQGEALAREAQELARSHHHNGLLGWAGWQLACLAACDGRAEEAVEHLAAAGEAFADLDGIEGGGQLAAFIEQTRALIQALADLQRQVLAHRRAAQEATQAGREAADRLHFFFQNPGELAGRLLETYGWSKVPLSIKMPASYAPQKLPTFTLPDSAPSGAGRLFEMLRSLLQPEPRPPAVESAPEAPPQRAHPPSQAPPPQPIPATGSRAEEIHPPPLSAQPPTTEPTPPPADELSTDAAGSEHSSPPAAPTEGLPASRQAKPIQPEDGLPHRLALTAAAVEHAPTLNAYMLGKFRVTLNDMVLSSWPSGRGRSVFAYLLAQRGQPVLRDLLMDTFWPDSTPESARNSLNVAVYNLRHMLKNALDYPVILFYENAYRINPKMHVWNDVVEFEARVRSARESEAGGATGKDAAAGYEQAVSLYNGDFLADAPYEEWAALERERLRVLYLDTLDHLSLLYFNVGQYAACVSLCQRMLSHDSCREDAHCRLMRCYSRQGQVQLALRQYQACVDALRSEMDVEPAAATVQLYEQIRRREMV